MHRGEFPLPLLTIQAGSLLRDFEEPDALIESGACMDREASVVERHRERERERGELLR